MEIEKKINSAKDYLELFSEKIKSEKKLEETLKQALEIRKFEIELYWKRANYFWAFIAASFAGYFVIINSKNLDNFRPITIAVSIIGLLFSLGWYLVNRGSKYWQKNWETHVSLLEDEIIGPLFKTVLNPQRSKLFDLSGEYPFSVSKINQILSLVVFLIWIYILIYSIDFTLKLNLLDKYSMLINMIYFGFVMIIALYQLYRHSEGTVSKDIKKGLNKEVPPLLITIKK